MPAFDLGCQLLDAPLSGWHPFSVWSKEIQVQIASGGLSEMRSPDSAALCYLLAW
ncbi:hypothetical protein KTAU_39710 [Thermogemmatispora aurantia]|uniref:Uncharacterized protein n=1 Tax=Thermogemmatispora aurantia TaxID=2045279 RepID=A0A5J4KID7_9CHLR|nr:hypothetical protein KTAU_39710 [Thermogemmatispora aurantia]